MRTNDIIKVHLYDSSNKEIKTKNYGKTFCVYEKNGKLGIDWNTERSLCSCEGDIFTPFETFAQSVIFENIETGELFHFSNIEKAVVSIEIAWI